MRDRVDTSSGLVLRRWKAEDARAVMTAFADPLMRAQSIEPVDSVQAAERWLTARGDQWAADSSYSFAVVDGGGLVLGQVCVGPVDRRHATGWVSYWTTATARGRGVASRACRAVARWAFDDAELFRLELGHRVNNPASCGVARAAGFAVEGQQRQKLEYDGVRFDVELHARLATDPGPTSTFHQQHPDAALARDLVPPKLITITRPWIGAPPKPIDK
ncbi:GNAT family N-acetyltransferase [Streptomyces sp. SP2-10]|uniref:GNAT family N-acetyltransferase n=1 Tax=Streptomyces sp. SP2-10 TaxID=2873385 RepID=UPI001CA765D1|nr:GNAT family protein [Streptomyces sp. SP2-10]MBY8845552.1 GNAT family N-acetyltransferase [Streptomyces sp. SP2-10]